MTTEEFRTNDTALDQPHAFFRNGKKFMYKINFISKLLNLINYK